MSESFDAQPNMNPMGGMDFSSLLGGMDFGALLNQAQQFKTDLEASQEQLKNQEFTASAGDGLVKATILGSGELVSLVIDPKICQPEEAETLADLIVAACRKAHSEANDTMNELLSQLPNLSAFGLGQ